MKHKIDIFGMLKLNRKDVPSKLRKEKLKKGEIMAYQRGKVCVMKWKDKKDVALLSTIHNSQIIKNECTGNNNSFEYLTKKDSL